MKLVEKLIRYRFLIAAALIALGVVFNLNGSSLSLWSDIAVHEEDTGLLAGRARMIRTDEWGCLTPMTLSQAYGDHPYSQISDIVRGGDTDVFMVYALPVAEPAVVFHPFHIGYLLFGSERGLSFFWCARLIVLLLVTFDFLRLLTENNILLSFLGAISIAFAPVLQWWFAINGFVEMLIFGQLIILCTDALMREEKYWKRLLYTAVIIWSAGCYALTMYPAWMIPFAYVFLAFFIWVIVKNHKGFVLKAKDALTGIGALFVLAACLFGIAWNSRETIELVLNTAYPGKRTDTGGGQAIRFFFYPGNIFFAWTHADGIPLNVCEDAMFYSFAPLGLILSVYQLIRKKGKDVLTILLFVVYGLLALYSCVGLPAFLAKITLLSMSQAIRTPVALSFIDLVLLLRSVAAIRAMRQEADAEPLPKYFLPLSCLLSAVLSFVMVFGARIFYGPVYFSKRKVLVLAAFLFLAFLLFLLYAFDARKKRLSTPALGLVAAGCALLCGLPVNPLQHGFGDLYETDLAQEMLSITEADPDGDWVVADGTAYPLTNYAIMMGAPTLNSTNTYPNIDLWEKIDPDEKYLDVYNRYAHVTVDIVDEAEGAGKEKFSLAAPDNFNVNMTTEDLETLGVSYVLSREDLSKYSDSVASFLELFSGDGYHVYSLQY